MALSQKKRDGYKNQIDKLVAALDQQDRSLAEDLNGKCAFASDKLTKACQALESDDEETTWFHLYGAATFCKANNIQPGTAAAVALMTDRLLSQA